MRYCLIVITFLISLPLYAAPWPRGLVQSTFDSCVQVGGESQCQCVVVNLQEKFTFEDMKLAMTNRLAKEALDQMVRTFNMKCLSKEFKQDSFEQEDKQKPSKSGPRRFR